MALNKVALRRPATTYRLLVVTFDLTDTVAGDPRYAQADQALAMHGELFNPVKQIRLLITRASPKRIRASLDQRIGRQTSILVAPLTVLPAWHIYGAGKRRIWRRFVESIRDHGIQIAGLTSDPQNPE